MDKYEPIAHPGKGNVPDESLYTHLQRVSVKARELATLCNPNDPALTQQAERAGWLHDVGKFPKDWQAYLRAKVAGQKPGVMPHAYHGAFLSYQTKCPEAMFAIAAHHAGLVDRNTLKATLKASPRTPAAVDMQNIRTWLTDNHIEYALDLLSCPKIASAIDQDMWTRMLTSILIDADRLATEFNDKGVYRTVTPLEPEMLFPRLLQAIEKALAEKKESNDTLLQARAEFLASCIEHGGDPQSWFTATGPTGLGKTLSLMAFALKHAIKHKLRRIIIVVPFLSIIEQTSKVYRMALERRGEDIIILEHHSNVEMDKQTGRQPPATENWDVPIIITTSVQFFESLLASPSGKIRKIHNIPGSVLIFDEPQSFPVGHLTPITSVIDQLVTQWGCTAVLSSATQPRLDKAVISEGYAQATELVPNPPKMFRDLRRVDYRYDFILHPKRTIDNLALELSRHPQVLCVCNTKGHAADLYKAMKRHGLTQGLLHLSAFMCPSHRLNVISEVKRKLDLGEPCVLIATQVVEAGCDLDFPIAYREICPLDNLVQTAGRVNREGKLSHRGLVIVFSLVDTKIPPGTYKRGTVITQSRLNPGKWNEEWLASDPTGIIATYFRMLYGKHQDACDKGDPTDVNEIQNLRKNFRFKTIWAGSEDEGDIGHFRIIGQDTVSVMIPYGTLGEALLEEFRNTQEVTRTLLRRMQPFLVSLYRNQYSTAVENGLLRQVRSDYEDLACITQARFYDAELGLQVT